MDESSKEFNYKSMLFVKGNTLTSHAVNIVCTNVTNTNGSDEIVVVGCLFPQHFVCGSPFLHP